MAKRVADVVSRFLDKFTVGDGCWEWTAGLASNGYGNFWLDGGTHSAHRLSYELFVGPVPATMHLDHLCRVRHCVRPSHLEPVTARENLMRGVGLSAVAARKTHCASGHPFDAENTRIHPSGQRVCRACHRAWRKKYRGVSGE
jgi:HNH endonuclease